jgi:hypothetical protein
VARRFPQGGAAKKISGACRRASAGAGAGDIWREDGTGGTGGTDGTKTVVNKYFGDETLFSCYEFLHEMHVKPRSWEELFEFLKYIKVLNMFKKMAMAEAKAAANGKPV